MRTAQVAGLVVTGSRGLRRGAVSMWLLLLLLPVIGLVLGFLGGVVAAYVTPKQYESRAMVQVTPVARPDGVAEVNTEQYFATELEVVRAKANLDRVVEQLDLAMRWKLEPDACVEELRKLVRVRQLPGTNLIEVRVRHESAKDARDVAEQVVTQYRDRRNEGEVARAMKELDALDRELAKQEAIVAEKRKVLDTIVQAVGLSAIKGEGGGKLGRALAEIQQAREQNLQELERERESLEIQMTKIAELKHEELLAYAAGLQVPQNGVGKLYEEYRRELTALNDLLDDGMGDGHPKVVAQRVRVDVFRKDLDRSVEVLREILETQMEIVDSRLERIQQVANARREGSFDRGLDEQDYLSAKRDYDEAVALHQQMKLQQSTKRIEAAVPKEPITIHETPKIGRAPVAPKVPLYLAGGALGGAALGVVLALVIGLVGKVGGRLLSSEC